MCAYKLLAYGGPGYLIRCKSCSAYQLAFGTTLISTDDKGFRQLQIQAAELSIITVPNGFPDQKRIRIRIPSCENAAMMLSHTELEQLYLLLEEAVMAEKLEYMLEINRLAPDGEN